MFKGPGRAAELFNTCSVCYWEDLRISSVCVFRQRGARLESSVIVALCDREK